jgi:hypothetical protein
MNNRIFELAKQVELIQWDKLPSGAITPDYESVVKAKRFAELIVKECLGKIENEAAQYAEPVWAFELVNDIKEHFGVEL